MHLETLWRCTDLLPAQISQYVAPMREAKVDHKFQVWAKDHRVTYTVKRCCMDSLGFRRRVVRTSTSIRDRRKICRPVIYHCLCKFRISLIPHGSIGCLLVAGSYPELYPFEGAGRMDRVLVLPECAGGAGARRLGVEDGCSETVKE